VTDEDWQGDLDLKLFAAIRLCRLALPSMKQRKWGSIVKRRAILEPPSAQAKARAVEFHGDDIAAGWRHVETLAAAATTTFLGRNFA
jgi:hypothetical protein